MGLIGAQCNNQTELGGAGGKMGGTKVSNNLSILFGRAPSLYSRELLSSVFCLILLMYGQGIMVAGL